MGRSLLLLAAMLTGCALGGPTGDGSDTDVGAAGFDLSTASDGATACSPANCAGCCADDGSCVAGIEDGKCGSDGVSCVDCGAAECTARVCEGCEPSCLGVACGQGDGCGSACLAGQSACCDAGCAGIECGQPNGCGVACAVGSGCTCTADCQGLVCGTTNTCGITCTAGDGCCEPVCDDRNCGEDDGCGRPCAPGSGCCDAVAEMLDGADNDCDTLVDEPYWVDVFGGLPWTDFSGQQPPCDSSLAAFTAVCMSAGHRYCTARGYSGGMGAIEASTTDGSILCVADAAVEAVPFGELTLQHSGCTFSTVFGIDCNSAMHRYCMSLGFASGFGPVEYDTTTAYLVCTSHGQVLQTTFAELQAQHPVCTFDERFSGACRAAIDRWCVANGHVAGFGPVEVSDMTTLYLTCLDDG